MAQAAEDRSRYDALVARCIEARQKYERAEVEYLVYLIDVEDNASHVWKMAVAVFDDFLQDVVGKPEPARYRRFRAAVDKLGINEVRRIGVDASEEALRLDNGERQEFTHAVRAWVKEHDGVHPSSQCARDIRRKVAPRKVIPMPVRREIEVEALRRECAALKARVRALESENKSLRAQLAKGAGVVVKKGGARNTARK